MTLRSSKIDTLEMSRVENVENTSSTDIELVEEDVSEKITIATVMAFLAICGQLNAYEMSLLIPASTSSYINADLGPDPSYSWINVSWTLGAAILVSISGRLSDIFGRRYFLLTGASISVIGTIVGATGQSINQMIAASTLMGIGSGFQEMGYGCIMEFIPNKYRLLSLGLYGTSALPSLCSPLIAYAFIGYTSAGWRGTYWFMFAWHTAAIIFLWFFYKPPSFYTKHSVDHKTKRTLLAEIDYIGLLLFTVGCTLFLIGVNFGGRKYTWSSPATLAPLALGVFMLIALGFWECLADLKYPLLPPKLFKQIRGFDVNLGIGFLCGMLYYSMQVLWPQEAALLFIPANNLFMRGVYSNITAWGTWLSLSSVWLVCAHLHRERWQIVFFICVQTALIGGLSTVGVSDMAKAIALVFTLACTINQPLYMLFATTTLSLADQADIGVAVGVLSTFRLMGGALATAMYTAILTNSFSSKLPNTIETLAKQFNFTAANTAALLKAATKNTAAAYKLVPGITPAIISRTQLAVKVTYTESYRVVYLSAIAFGMAGIVCALFTISTPRELKSNHRAVILENEKKFKDDLETPAIG